MISMSHRGTAAPAHDERQRLHLGWLVKLRWGAAAGQALTILVAKTFYEAPWAIAPLVALIAIELSINVVCALWLARGRAIGGAWLAAVLGADVLILTGLLAGSGGASNPFSFVYLVYLALAAVILESRYTWALVVLSLAASGTLFSGTLRAEDDGHAHHMQHHLRGMWIAFGVSACFIVYFITRVSRSAERLSAALETERASAARNERLVSLATLAAGAAHELATPLGTVAIVVRELERQLAGAAADDARLAREQLDRCRAILDDMAAGSGQHVGEPLSEISVDDLVGEAVRAIDPAALEVALGPHGAERLRLPVRAMTRAVAGLVRNAVQASAAAPAPARVRITAHAEADELRLDVRDGGPGMAPDVLARAGEPFFTTKAPGRGMGLGLFLARSLVEQLGGRLRLASTVGQGTCVSVHLPAATACRIASGPRTAQDVAP